MLRSTALLARAFFGRFFESELMQQGMPQIQLVIWSVALVVAPGLLLSLRSALSYSRLRLASDTMGLTQALRLDRLLLIAVSMAVLGFVGLVIWDGLFPDRRDARHLGVLPLPGRMLIAARLMAMCAIAALFLIGVNAIPTLTYGSLAGEYGSAISTWRGVVAHGLATACAGAFAFFALIALQGALLNVVGRRAAARWSMALRVITVAACLQLVFLLPELRLLAIAHADLASISADPALRWIPLFWFLGLYDVLAGTGSGGSAPLAVVAVIATATATIAAIGLFAGTHRRLMRLALEGRDTTPATRSLTASAIRFIVRLTDRGPLSHAVAHFTIVTIVRSQPHRLLLSTYLGLACAIIVSENAPLIVRHGWSALREPGIMTLAAPLVLQFCALIGMRLLLAIPAEPKANWIIRLLEPRDRRIAIDAVRDVLLAMTALPITVLTAAIALTLWGPWLALMHTATCAAMGWLLVESLLVGFRKIPFTCTYFPGRSRARMLWPFYLLALLAYSIGTATIELAVAAHPWHIVLFLAAVAVIIAVLTWIRGCLLAEPFGLRFEEEDPDALFPGFRLSERLAGRR